MEEGVEGEEVNLYYFCILSYNYFFFFGFQGFFFKKKKFHIVKVKYVK